LSKEELQQGAVILEEKIGRIRPEAVCIVGKGVWEYIWLGRFLPKGKKKKDFHVAFRYGWQDEDAWLGRTEDENGVITWPGARTFVSTTTSAASTYPSRQDSLEIWKPLGKWFTERRMKQEEA
jgi:thymine-DNA glycosylase